MRDRRTLSGQDSATPHPPIAAQWAPPSPAGGEGRSPLSRPQIGAMGDHAHAPCPRPPPRPGLSRVQGARGGQRRLRAARRAPVLVRRERPGHSRLHPPRCGRGAVERAHLLHPQPGPAGAADRARQLSPGPARLPHRPGSGVDHQFRRLGPDGGDAGDPGPRRPGGDRHPSVAEPVRDPPHPERRGGAGGPGAQGRRLGARFQPPARRHHAGHAAGAAELAQQPHRLGAGARAARAAAGPLPQARRLADGRRRL